MAPNTNSKNYATVAGLPGTRKNHSKYFTKCVKLAFAKKITKVQKFQEFFSNTVTKQVPRGTAIT